MSDGWEPTEWVLYDASGTEAARIQAEEHGFEAFLRDTGGDEHALIWSENNRNSWPSLSLAKMAVDRAMRQMAMRVPQ